MMTDRVVRRLTIPASHAAAVAVRKGEILDVVNTHGTQVVDTWAFNAGDRAEFMSMAHTRSVNSRVWPAFGQSFVSIKRRPMLYLIADTSPGVHDTLLCGCNRAIYAELGCTEYHRNCEDNLHEALAAAGMDVGFTPAPLNLFMNVAVAEDGAVVRAAPVSRAGDCISLRTGMDLVVVLSACPQDITPINGDARMPRDVEAVVRRASR
jgi:uncharacterized protein YcgI (DUF1989 family)